MTTKKGVQMHVNSSSEETWKPQSEEEAQAKKSFSVDISARSRFIKNIFCSRCLSAGMEFVSWAVPQWEYRRRILNDSDSYGA